MWIKEFHGHSQSFTKNRPVAKPRPKATPNLSGKAKISDLVKKMPRKQQVKGDDDDFQMDLADPEIAYLAQKDWDAEWQERLQMYKDFLR
jgi:hypothetical protein